MGVGTSDKIWKWGINQHNGFPTPPWRGYESVFEIEDLPTLWFSYTTMISRTTFDKFDGFLNMDVMEKVIVFMMCCPWDY